MFRKRKLIGSPSSLLSPKRGADAGVGVGMLRVWGIPLIENKNKRFLGLLVSRCRSFLVSWIRDFKVPEFHFNDSKIQQIIYLMFLEEIDPISPDVHFMFSGRY